MKQRRFIPGVVAPDIEPEDGWCIPVHDFHPLLTETQPVLFPRIRKMTEEGYRPTQGRYLGQLDGEPVYTFEIVEEVEPPSGLAFFNLRELWSHVPDEIWALAGRAVHIVDWDRTHQFCGRCGAATVDSAGERSRQCPTCGLRHYPRISPAVIVLVHDGERLLLGRSNRFPHAFYSVLAGFVEPGETLEETVEREIYEEAGIQVTDISYFGSQPWPFPNSLMIGFTARYAGGEIVLLDDEIMDAGWFTIDNLPRIPSKISIARQLIDWFIEKQGGTVSPE